MDFFSILTLFGGLALFLYGMDTMGKGLKKLSGNSLESILNKLTSNPIKGFFLGLGVTALIQSSSATIVMLVGFANSGIMKVAQTLGIIMDILYASVRHVLDIVRQALLARNLQQAVLKAFVGEILRILRIHHTHAIHDKAVRIHIRSSRTYGYCPHSLCVALHLLPPCKLHVE